MGRRIHQVALVVLALALFASVGEAAAPPPLTGTALVAPFWNALTTWTNPSWETIHSLWQRLTRTESVPAAEAGTPAGGSLTTPTDRAGLLVVQEATPSTSKSETEGLGRGDEGSGPWP